MIKRLSMRFVLPILLTVSLVIGVFALATFNSASADVIDQTNPELQFLLIDSSPNGQTYKAQGDFKQENGTYTIRSNTYVAWFESDDIAFAYQQYNIGSASTDTLDISVTVESQKPDTAGVSILHQNASVGIMMRDTLDPTGAEVYLHVRGEAIMMVYRMIKGNTDSMAVYTSIPEQYPVELRLVREGKLFTGYYRKVGSETWLKVGACSALFTGPTFGGIATHSCQEEVMSKSVLKNLRITGQGTYTGETDTSSGDTSGTQSGGTSSIEPGPEDPPADKNVLLRETFSDGSLTLGEASNVNPVWKNPSSENIVTLENGNRVWFRDYQDGYDFIGDQTWTDYTASVDVQFTKYCNVQANNIFTLYLRHIAQDMYGVFDYKVNAESYTVVENGKIQYDEVGNVLRRVKLTIRKRNRCQYTNTGTVVAEYPIGDPIGDGKFHTISVKALDNHLQVSWDGQQVIDWVDTSYLMNLEGCVGIGSYNTSVYVDNLIVTKLEDPLGGDYDNYIGGRFDQPAPDYIDDMKIPQYEFTTPPKEGFVERNTAES